MEGLLQKAIRLRARITRTAEDESQDSQSMGGISEEDRQDVVRTMNQVLAQNKIQVGPERFQIQPKKRGLLLPLMVNAIAVLLVLGGVVLFSRLFDLSTQESLAQVRALEGGESRLLETVREEADRKLAQKNQEIQRIQQELVDLNKERSGLGAAMEARLKEKEAQLRQDLERELQRARSRLEAQGLSGAELEAQLRAAQTDQQKKFQNDLAGFQKQMDDERLAMEADLRRRESDFQSRLGDAENQRKTLADEAERTRKDLEAQLARERLDNQARQQESDSRLKSIQATMAENARQKIILDNLDNSIDSWHEGIRRSLEENNGKAFPEVLQAYGQFLAGDAFGGSREALARRNREQFILGLLQDLAEFRRKSGVSAGLVEKTLVIDQVRDLYASAQTAQTGGNTMEAMNYYSQILQAIPEVNEAWKTLEGQRKQGPGISAGQDSLGTGFTEGSSRTPALVSALEAPDWEQRKAEVVASALAPLWETIAQLQGGTRTLEQQLAALRQRESQLQAALRDERSKNASLDSRLQAALGDTALADAQTRIRQLEDELSTTRTRLADSQTQLQVQGLKLQQVQKTLEDTQNLMAANQEGSGDLVAGLQSRLAQADTDLEQARADQTRTEAALDQARQALRQSQDAASTWETRAGTAASARDEAVAQLAKARADLEAQAAELAAQGRSNRDLESRLTQTATALEASEASLRALQGQSADKADLARLTADLQKSNAALEALEQESLGNKTALEAAIQARTALEAQVLTLNTQVSSLRQSYESSQKQVETLQSELSGARDNLAQVQASLDQWLGEREKLEDLKASWLDYLSQAPSSLEDPVEATQARLNLDRFLASEGLAELLPGMYRQIGMFNQAFEKSGAQSRQFTINDLMFTLLSYSRPEERRDFLKRLGQEKQEEDYLEFLRMLDRLLEP